MASCIMHSSLVGSNLRHACRTNAFQSRNNCRLQKLSLQLRAKKDTTSSDRRDAPVSVCADFQTALLGTTGLIAPLLAGVAPALANEQSFLLTGRTVSLAHPAIMFFLLGATLYTGILGLQWKRLRTIPAEIKDLKAQLPPANAEGQRPPSELDSKIASLEADRKDLAKGNFREKHFNWGSLLLGLGVTFAVIGPVNTYLRTGKLFPGPHLYAGAAITVLWAAAASMVPLMQKGNDAARTAHISFNIVNLLLFAWQVPTGLEIVYKVFQFTTFP